MRLAQIIDGLGDAAIPQAEAEPLARMALLEWVLTLPDGSNLRFAAHLAANRCAEASCTTPALRAFEVLLREAEHAPVIMSRRHNRRRQIH